MAGWKPTPREDTEGVQASCPIWPGKCPDISERFRTEGTHHEAVESQCYATTIGQPGIHRGQQLAFDGQPTTTIHFPLAIHLCIPLTQFVRIEQLPIAIRQLDAIDV